MKKIPTFFLLIFYSVFFGQSSYEITYNFKDEFGFTSESKLCIDGEECVFKINDKRKKGSWFVPNHPDNLKTLILNDELSTFIYSNRSENKVRIVYYKGKEVLYTTSNDSYKWQITKEEKKIGNYNCIKATLRLNNREYTVWFSTEIPISFGPLKLHGLPGLIVAVKEKDGFFEINLTGIKKELNREKLIYFREYFEVKKRKVLSYDRYQSYVTKIATDLKINQLAIVAQVPGANIYYDEDQGEFTKRLIDIPDNFVVELQQIN
ncbi:GLPGLI family protein [Aquimarina sp. ERC-38]|uniref:GLPGLI family protein n=1 Tax=Aquimarina sp. ERC-38 TaxID=2949996 RepID=UPI0022452BA2|nr:GLPGLI family protein [Aquimarina sp. ERC-38]UZO81431.1 GLPGLI family protein [Aquimarina sp. ERC-38]